MVAFLQRLYISDTGKSIFTQMFDQLQTVHLHGQSFFLGLHKHAHTTVVLYQNCNNRNMHPHTKLHPRTAITGTCTLTHKAAPQNCTKRNIHLHIFT